MLIELIYIHQNPPKSATKSRTITRALEMLPSISKKKHRSGESSYRYNNSHTEGCFDLHLYSPQNSDELGLSLEFTLPKPFHFALEVLPYAVQLARQLRCGIDFCSPYHANFYQNPNIEDLILEFEQFNQDAISDLQDQEEEPRFYYSEPKMLESLWEYQLLLPELSKRYHHKKISVEKAYLCYDQEEQKVVSATDWNRLQPSVFPAVDWIRLVDPPKPLKGNVFYPTDELRHSPHNFFKDSSLVLHHHLCKMKSQDRPQVLQTLQQTTNYNKERFRKLRWNEVLDQP